MVQIAETIDNYLKTLDNALSRLSIGNEGKIAKLPSWVLTGRDVTVVICEQTHEIAIKATENSNLNTNRFEIKYVDSSFAVIDSLRPARIKLNNQKLWNEKFFVQYYDIIISGVNPLSMPRQIKGLFAYGHLNQAIQHYTHQEAKKDALSFWNAALNDLRPSSNYIHEALQVLYKFSAVITQRAFLERRIHRFINEHAQLLLPSHTEKFFEHVIKLHGKERIADFILQREDGLPPMLIELEAPRHRVFTLKGELTEKAHDARIRLQNGFL